MQESPEHARAVRASPFAGVETQMSPAAASNAAAFRMHPSVTTNALLAAHQRTGRGAARATTAIQARINRIPANTNAGIAILEHISLITARRGATLAPPVTLPMKAPPAVSDAHAALARIRKTETVIIARLARTNHILANLIATIALLEHTSRIMVEQAVIRVHPVTIPTKEQTLATVQAAVLDRIRATAGATTVQPALIRSILAKAIAMIARLAPTSPTAGQLPATPVRRAPLPHKALRRATQFPAMLARTAVLLLVITALLALTQISEPQVVALVRQARTVPAAAALFALRVQLASTALALGCLLPAVTAKRARTLVVVQLP